MAVKGSGQISIIDLTDGYTVSLSQDAGSFTADSSYRAIDNSTSFTINITALQGSASIVPKIGTCSVKDIEGNTLDASDGITVAVGSGNASPVVVTISGGSSQTVFAEPIATVNIPVYIEGDPENPNVNTDVIINKVFTISAAAQGAAGESGTDGRDITSVTYYYLLQPSTAPAPSTPATVDPPAGWSTTEPSFVYYVKTSDVEIDENKTYYVEVEGVYTRVDNPVVEDIGNYYERLYHDAETLYVTVRTLYSDATFEYSTPSIASAYAAAKEAYERARTAAELAEGMNQYFWNITTAEEGDPIVPGVYVTSIPSRRFTENPSEGNVLVQSEGITLRDGLDPLTSWTREVLNFYIPSSSDVGAQISIDGMLVNKGGIRNYFSSDDNMKLYLSTEDYSTIDEDGYEINGFNTGSWRQIIGKNFGVTNEGILYSRGAQINGKFDVIAGSNIYTKTESNAFFNDIGNTTGALQWKDKYGQYTLTQDVLPQEDTVYYQAIYEYTPVADKTRIDPDITYYTQRIAEINYIQVESPIVEELDTYFEYVISSDTTIDVTKTYYRKTENEDNVFYEKVAEPVQSELDEHKYYECVKTSDTAIIPDKAYYQEVRTYAYDAVDDPVIAEIDDYFVRDIIEYKFVNLDIDDNPNELGLYELDSLTQSMNDYLTSHLSMREDGLWLEGTTTGDNKDYKIHLSPQGLEIFDLESKRVSSFGENIDFSSDRRQHIGGANTYIEFVPENIAYTPNETAELDPNKTYCIRSGEEPPYTYTVVTEPQDEDKENYYIREVIPEHLVINASNIHIGQQNINTLSSDLTDAYEAKLDEVRTELTAADGQLNERIEGISTATQMVQDLSGYIDISPELSRIRIGNRNAYALTQDTTVVRGKTYYTRNGEEPPYTYAVVINPNDQQISTYYEKIDSYIDVDAQNAEDMKVSMNVNRTEVASFGNAGMVASSAVITNLYMQTRNAQGQAIGSLGWIMRSNGHLSLKEIGG